MNKTKKLTKSFDKKLFGVAGGIADYLHVDPLLIRLIMVALFFAFDGVFLIYLVLALLLPAATNKFDIILEKDPSMVSY